MEHYGISKTIKKIIEKVISTLDEYDYFKEDSKQIFADCFKVRKYALDASFPHETFEDFKSSLITGSLKTFYLALKRWEIDKRIKVPKPLKHKILFSTLKFDGPLTDLSSYIELAKKELTEEKSVAKTFGKKTAKNHRRQICVIN